MSAGSLDRLLGPLKRRIMLMIGRSVVALVDDSLKMQGLQITLLADEVRDGAERFQNYGFTSHPHPGAEAIAACVAGNRDHVVVLAVDDRRFRLKSLAQGEVALYTDEGDKVVLKRGGVIEVNASTKVHLITPLVECTGDLQVDGDVHVDGNVVVDGQVTAPQVHGTVNVTFGGKSGIAHVHNNVLNGPDNTGAPV